jgi:hypothetical protein
MRRKWLEKKLERIDQNLEFAGLLPRNVSHFIKERSLPSLGMSGSLSGICDMDWSYR